MERRKEKYKKEEDQRNKFSNGKHEDKVGQTRKYIPALIAMIICHNLLNVNEGGCKRRRRRRRRREKTYAITKRNLSKSRCTSRDQDRQTNKQTNKKLNNLLLKSFRISSHEQLQTA